MGTRRASGQGPGSVQETDTRARSGSGGYPARGSSAILYYGLERSKQLRRRPPARHRNCAPPAPPASTDPGKNPGRPRPETRQRRKGTQFSSHHGRAAKRRMYSFTEIADPQRLARVADAWPRDAAKGRLGQVCDRWIYSACLCFGLELAEQQASGFRYAYSVYQAEYSRNLLFKSGAQMEDLFDRIVDRTRSRLDIPAIRTLFGLRTRPHRDRKTGPPAQEIVIEKPRYGLSWFRISFGRLQLKAYTKGEHVLRFEATVHNTKDLRCRRSLENFAEIIAVLARMADRFATALDCADTGFLPDGALEQLPLPSQAGGSRIAGIDLNKPRIRAALSAAFALAPAPSGFTVAEHAARVRQITGHDRYTTRQAAYDLRKLRGKHLVEEPARTRCYHVPPASARIISALLTLRNHVIAPILAGVGSPRMGRKPKIWTSVDRDYETLRIGMQTLFRHVGIETQPEAA